MVVVDTPAVLDVLVVDRPAADLARRLETAGEWHAPHLLDVGVLHALRRLVRGGRMILDRAQDAGHRATVEFYRPS